MSRDDQERDDDRQEPQAPPPIREAPGCRTLREPNRGAIHGLNPRAAKLRDEADASGTHPRVVPLPHKALSDGYSLESEGTLGPLNRLRAEWPLALGAMVQLSQVNLPQLVTTTGVDVDFADPSEDQWAGRVFSEIRVDDLALLSKDGGAFALDTIETFLASIWRFGDRFVGDGSAFAGAIGHMYEQAMYSLIYLSRTREVAALITKAYAPLLRPGLFSTYTRYRICRTLGDDVLRLLYDLEQLEPAGDHEMFDWFGAVRVWPDAERLVLLDFAGLPPFDNVAYPPQHVWLWHTNLQPEDDRWWHDTLCRFYLDRGHPPCEVGEPSEDECCDAEPPDDDDDDDDDDGDLMPFAGPDV